MSILEADSIAVRPHPFVAGRGWIQWANNPCEPVFSEAIAGSLYGWIAPVAMESPDGDMLAYTTWTPGGGRLGGTPSIRLRTLGCGNDVVLANNAASFAWRRDGVFAYFKITGVDRGGLPIGQVVTIPSPNLAPAPGTPSVVFPLPWTHQAARWIVAAWAQDRLIAYQELEGEALHLFVLDEPGRIRPLGPADTNVRLVAVSPDGSQAVVALGEGGDVVAVFDVGSGEELSRIDLTGLVDPQTGSSFGVSYAGSWTGRYVAASGGPGLMLFTVSNGRIALARVLRITDGIEEPQLIRPPELRGPVIGWQHASGGKHRSRWLECDLDLRTCQAGPYSPSQLYSVYNPSRPMKG